MVVATSCTVLLSGHRYWFNQFQLVGQHRLSYYYYSMPISINGNTRSNRSLSLILFPQCRRSQLIESVITYVPIFIRIGPFNLFFFFSSSVVGSNYCPSNAHGELSVKTPAAAGSRHISAVQSRLFMSPIKQSRSPVAATTRQLNGSNNTLQEPLSRRRSPLAVTATGKELNCVNVSASPEWHLAIISTEATSQS